MKTAETAFLPPWLLRPSGLPANVLAKPVRVKSGKEPYNGNSNLPPVLK